jgi:hypothetical protein
VSDRFASGAYGKGGVDPTDPTDPGQRHAAGGDEHQRTGEGGA